MSRSRLSYFTCAIFIFLVLAWVGTETIRYSEPVYEGHTLTEWLYENRKAPLPESGHPDPKEPKLISEKAIRAIGTNALPTLLRMMAAKDAPIKTRFIALSRRQTFLKTNIQDAHSKRFLAYLGFQILGSDAKDAVPELATLARNDDVDIRVFSLSSLDFIKADKKDFLPVLLDLIQDPARSPYDPDPSIGFRAAEILYRRFPEEVENTGASKKPEFIKWAASKQFGQ